MSPDGRSTSVARSGTSGSVPTSRASSSIAATETMVAASRKTTTKRTAFTRSV
jgi:hypothetical protein